MSSSGFSEPDWISRLAHLNDNHMKFFRKWDKLIDIEFGAQFDDRSDIWNVVSNQKELNNGKYTFCSTIELF